ncbi:MAG: pyridoxal phosphate-dependent aminotransferase [Spirochaetales bacterium]|nr:pyridoxal phosphate-dependent aminotransferase [Spirochaetales bacterium]
MDKKVFQKSSKLASVCYDIRGPVLEKAIEMEMEGHRILKLNTGNPAAFGFETPEELIVDIKANIANAMGYCDSKGIFPARKAIMQYYQTKGIFGIDVNDIYLGNGASELIVMTMQGLLNNGDEILIPSPDYPLWTAAVSLAGGNPVHYICDEKSNWYPDVEDIKSKITDKTKGIVIINPNNPTGAVYPKEIIEAIAQIAEEKKIILFSDEIYDKILYDDAVHHHAASFVHNTLCITFNGLSKSYRAAGFRVGWMVLSGNKGFVKDYIEGLDILSNMRLCSNVLGQIAVQAALGGYQSIKDLLLPEGRLKEQRDAAYETVKQIPGLSCVKPQGALYLFPKINTKKFNITDDRQFVYDLLVEKKILLVQGTGFNLKTPDHFRIVFLPYKSEIESAINSLGDFLQGYQQQ